MDEIRLTVEEAKAAHEFVWTALLPDRALSPAERAMGEYVLARLAAHLDALNPVGSNYCPESSLVAWGAHLIAEQERDA